MNVRAATPIVGALAFSSILIALAFLFSDGDSTVRSPTATRSAGGHVEQQTETPPVVEEESVSSTDRLTPCSSTEVSVEGTSCEVGAAVLRSYDGGSRGEIVVESRDGAVSVSCGGTAPVICTGAGGVAVYLPGS